jgi:hypothetical protein
MGVIQLYVCVSPFLAINTVAGVILILRKDRFSKFAGFLTIKPTITTFFWGLILGFVNSPQHPELAPYYFLSVLPAVILTVLIVFIFRQILFTTIQDLRQKMTN